MKFIAYENYTYNIREIRSVCREENQLIITFSEGDFWNIDSVYAKELHEEINSFLSELSTVCMFEVNDVLETLDINDDNEPPLSLSV